MRLDRNKSYGPYEVINKVGLACAELFSLDWSDVDGCQVILSVADNYGQQGTFTFARQFWATAEIEIWGSVQGYAECIKRQQVRQDSGPLLYAFESEGSEPYNKVSFRARNISGGRLGAAQPTNTTSPIAANGFYLKVSAYFQPRSGFAR